ncbi:glycerophosphodiester phosphodiesterase family protein [Oesophagostomum dentatum]|uniref:Glycerophosphodiester phosphodiesterase family protein n=1 Tax=Oesophagostomum dentatum TaxID=61180 RepID=A0A0B1TC58_OESDE|nr:glycerophosphodiester phosphodiesterase family protein [Oesophagostomum dentatum]
MVEKTRVQFRVRVLRLKLWEKVLVCGSDASLGEWDPLKAFPLTKSATDSDVWVGNTEISDVTDELTYRYLVGYYLDPCTEGSKQLLIVHRWESFLMPRSLQLSTSQNFTVDDIFGNYDGNALVSDGWIIHNEENVVLLRVHSEALKFYKSSYRNKEHRVKIVPFDVRFKEVLSREDPIFGNQYVNGSIFRNKIDYLIFRTRTVSLEHLAFRIELFHEMDRIGLAYALPAALPDLYGKATFPIISLKNIPIGQIEVDYMLVKPLPMDHSLRDHIAVSWGRYWKKRSTLEVGHRGMGSSYTKMAAARENTIHSLSEAARKGADYVEFDVQLTKDMQPIIYHDFHVMVEVAGRKRDLFNQKVRHHQLAIKDLSLDQLHLLHLEHPDEHTNKTWRDLSLDQLHLLHLEHPDEHTNKTWRVTPSEEEDEDDTNPFPHLRHVMDSVSENVGFNIEIKYPMKMKDGTHECPSYNIERNEFVDVILRNVIEGAGKRRIIFSSFDPDVCCLITLKQHIYPVMFLVVGPTTRYTPFQDIRTDCSKLAVNFAAGNGLLGVNFHSEELLQDAAALHRAEQFNLVSFVWGDDLNIVKNLDYFRDLHVDGVIYDRIGEVRPRRNTFVVENESRKALPIRTPECVSNDNCSYDVE